MVNEQANREADQDSDTEHQAHQPSRNWRNIFKGVSHDLFTHSWGQNIVVSIALLLIAPAIGFWLMKDARGMLFGFGVGITILFWIIWLAIIRQIAPSPPPKTVDNKTNSALETPTPTLEDMKKKDDRPNINITSTNQGPGGFTGYNSGTVNLSPPPRSISPANLTKFKAVLATGEKGKVELSCPPSDPEAEALMTQIETALKEVGFDVESRFVLDGAKPAVGVELRVNATSVDQTDLPKHAGNLQFAFVEIGFPVNTIGDDWPRRPNTVLIRIGSNQQ